GVGERDHLAPGPYDASGILFFDLGEIITQSIHVVPEALRKLAPSGPDLLDERIRRPLSFAPIMLRHRRSPIGCPGSESGAELFPSEGTRSASGRACSDSPGDARSSSGGSPSHASRPQPRGSHRPPADPASPARE